MADKTILVTFNADGTFEIETKGFDGRACKAATADLEHALGTVTSDRLTREAHETESRNEGRRERR
jgi:Protein of unknown function (DUF2997)